MGEFTRLGFDPYLGWPLIGLLGAGAFGLWVVYLARRGRAWLTRALALTLLGLALANPQWIREEREPLKNVVAVVVDRSESMRFGNRNATADAVLDQLRAELGENPGVELRVVETDPSHESSDLYGELLSTLADAPRERIGGAILVTDGQVHDLPADPAAARPFGPVHSLVVGAEKEFDRRIEVEAAPGFGIVDDSIELTIRVADPSASSLPVKVSINGTVVETVTTPTGVSHPVTVRLPQRGENLVVFQVDELPGELTRANNLASAEISGVRDRLRVLLVTGEPHPGARVWRDLLKSDPSVDLVHFTILRPPDKFDAASNDELALIAFPVRELFDEKLDRFDLVIFDHYRSRGVLPYAYLDNIARYVENGGALFVATGPPREYAENLATTSLAAVLPGRPTGEVVQQHFRPQLTDLGRRHSVTAGLPSPAGWGHWERYMATEAKPEDTLIAAADGSPVFMLNRVARGRVAQLVSDQIWLWARGYDGGGPYAELIRRTAHWLMKEPELEEELLQLTARDGKLTAELHTLSAAPPLPVLEGPDGASVTGAWRRLEAGTFTAEFPVSDLGLFSVSAGELSSVTLHGPSHPREYADVLSTAEKLAPLARATGGGVVRVGGDGSPLMPDIRSVRGKAATAGDGWIGLRQREAYAVRATTSFDLLPGWAAMAVAIALMAMAWFREGR